MSRALVLSGYTVMGLLGWFARDWHEGIFVLAAYFVGALMVWEPK